MGARAILQPNKTFTGDSSVTGPVTIFSDLQDLWVDCLGWADAVVTVQVNSVSVSGADTIDVSIGTTHDKGYIGGSPPDGMLWTVKSFSSVATGWYKHAAVLKEQTASTAPVDRWLSLAGVVSGSSGPWSINLEAWVILKNPA